MSYSNHSRKPFTESSSVFFKRLFPTKLFDRLNKDFGIDTNRKKIRFRTFCIFLIMTVINQPHDVSSRSIENASKKASMQLLSGQVPISHTAIVERLKTIPSVCLETLLKNLTSTFRKKLKHKSKFLDGMKVFDVTSFSVSEKHYTWAAKKQSRANVRFLFIMDSRSGTPDSIINASKNLNDNKVFKDAISSARGADFFVFDKGFNNFSVFKDIIDSGKHFITRWKSNYIFSPTYNRLINPKEKLEGDWYIESDIVGKIGIKKDKDGIEVRKITCRNSKTKDKFIVMTDERNLAANKIVQMYVYRWPIEVFFRNMKSTLKVVKFPSHDPQGVKNWIHIIALSIIVIQLMNLDKPKEKFVSLMDRKSSFMELLRYAVLLFDRWFVNEIKVTFE